MTYGKQKASTLTERIRQANGLASSAPAETSSAEASFASASAVSASAQKVAFTSVADPAPAPVASAPVPSVASAVAVQPAPVASTPEVAPAPESTPASAPAPTADATNNYDTVALSSIAADINEFETKIKKLKVLRDNGILSEEEYLAEKKKLVSIF